VPVSLPPKAGSRPKWPSALQPAPLFDPMAQRRPRELSASGLPGNASNGLLTISFIAKPCLNHVRRLSAGGVSKTIASGASWHN